MASLNGQSNSKQEPGVQGLNAHGGLGVLGQSPAGTGVKGESDSGKGVDGSSATGIGVMGLSEAGPGIFGESRLGEAVRGISHGSLGAVVGVNDRSDPDAGQGLYGESQNGDGVRGISHSDQDENAGVSAYSPHGIGLFARGGRLAALFAGDVRARAFKSHHAVFAEEFNVRVGTEVVPGSVMVVDEDGALFPCRTAYDKRVAGVVSGAGGYSPGIVLDSQQNVERGVTRQAIALLGKVYCWADAQYGAIETGDMLTTSPTAGQAMKVLDPQKAFGSVIGKALGSLPEGQGLIPVLVTLQ